MHVMNMYFVAMIFSQTWTNIDFKKIFWLRKKSSVYTVYLILDIVRRAVLNFQVFLKGFMGHLSILMLIKVHWNQYTQTMLDFKVLQYLTKKCFKILGKVKIIKDPSGIVIMTHKFVFKVLPSCSTLLCNKFFV